jgi:hypothetical protein
VIDRADYVRGAPRPAVQADATRLPFRAECFAAVAALWMLYYLDRPEVVLIESTRVLRPGGTFVACTSSRYNDPEFAEPATELGRAVQLRRRDRARDHFRSFQDHRGDHVGYPSGAPPGQSRGGAIPPRPRDQCRGGFAASSSMEHSLDRHEAGPPDLGSPAVIMSQPSGAITRRSQPWGRDLATELRGAVVHRGRGGATDLRAHLCKARLHIAERCRIGGRS